MFADRADGILIPRLRKAPGVSCKPTTMQKFSKSIPVLLFLFISCSNNHHENSNEIIGNWSLNKKTFTDKSSKVNSANEIPPSAHLLLKTDSSFEMDNSGIIIPSTAAILLNLNDPILGFWHIRSDSLILVIKFQNKNVTDSYKIRHCDDRTLVLEQKQFEVKDYLVLQFSK